ncbi:hypothetical protein PHYPSEUDO_012301 [Phytophthora pseudosyringae]|uniref:Uncharacterized protein n=1 Tax=Phytophthora pseudosyringae TaxID=221518 RepID=A0A8T1W545_9STRA|nr:hypothetical protein PHYPSEUDO_012301 [Phytophthora pseudosyringae]
MNGSKEQTEEERELRLISWLLCDHFRDVFADGFSNCMVWPFEVVNPVLNTLTLEAIRLFDILSEGYSREHSRHARSQLKADLNSLANYFTTWNESKRVAFRDGKLPERATVSSVEENKINQYMAQQVQQEHTVFANTDVNFYTRLYENNQKKVKSLFSFAGKSFNAVKYRNEHKLRGQQDALGAFEVNHEVCVGERD